MNRLITLSTGLFPSDPRTGKIGSIEQNIWLAQLAGVPILGLKTESIRLKTVLLIYGIVISIFSTLIYTGFEMYDIILYWSDINVLTQNACLSLTHLAGLVKLIYTLYRCSDIRYIINQLKIATRKYVLTENQRSAFLRGELENKIILLIYTTMVGFTAWVAIFMLFNNPHNLAGKIFPYRVTLPSWLPYPLQLVYISFSLLIIALQIVAIDYLNMNFINQIRFQLKVLNLAFENLMIDVDRTVTPHKSSRIIQVKDIASLTPHQRLGSIIEHHCMLIRLRADVERVYRFTILVQFFTSVLIFALTGFRTTVPSEDLSNAMLIYFYCGCILCELFLYCWFGNDVFEQSKSLSSSGYNCCWYQFDQSFKRSLLIYQINAQRPFVFTAGGIMGVSLPSFTGILSKSYTYIAVLQTLYGK